MKRKLYAIELLRKLVSDKELRILEITFDEDLSTEEKIDILLKEE
jgi:hypothetical protein